MEFYGFSLAGAQEGHSHVDVLNDLLDCVEMSDRLGLDGWFFAEHHVDPYFSLSPSPNLLIAAASRRTQRLRLGNMVNILPYHNPLRVAEEIRMLDALTGGRLDVGFGRGQVRTEQAAFGTVRNDTVDMFDASFDAIRRLLVGETVDYDNRWWKGSQALAVPEAVQRPHPPLWMSAASDTSIEKSAKLGLHCATALLTRRMADERMAQFRRDWDRHNPARRGEGKFAIVANIAIADTFADAYAQVQNEFEKKQEHFARSITDTPGGDDQTYSSHREQYEAFAKGSADWLLDNHLLIAGTVEDCIKLVGEIKQRGIDVLICNFHTGHTPFHLSRRSLELFASEVVPAVEQRARPGMRDRLTL
ncbi:LLM class flavin-dependent oxidoreductase [Roseiarcaceae bacterium H3SJ34-1]|uniref:LLM class flavin-dependent oxidoreductase n=1 Tax=Terripilifer ovatus TaxID=3032367 RepID=UPI003AB980FF|nr:LLM class flavin-dependent oxidoreductase [Roseiarcaceae bacterium H3SJ34-1]